MTIDPWERIRATADGPDQPSDAGSETELGRRGARQFRWLCFALGPVFGGAAAALAVLTDAAGVASGVVGLFAVVVVLCGASVTVVDENQALLASSLDGTFTRAFGPGPTFVPALILETESIPTGPWEVTVPEQQGYGPNGEPVVVSAVARVRMTDPTVALREGDPRESAAAIVASVVRQGITEVEPGRIAANPSEFAGTAATAAAEAAAEHGLTVEAVKLTNVRRPAG